MRVSDAIIDDCYLEFLVKRNPQESLRILCAMFEAHAGSIILIGDGGTRILASQGLNVESLANYHGDLNKDDYMVPFLMENNNDKVLHAGTLVSLPNIEKSDFHNSAEKPSDIYDKIAYHIITPDAQIGVALYRDKKRVFSKLDVEQAEKLYPHIARCFRLIQRIETDFDDVFATRELTPREKEIATLIAMGNDYSKVASSLNISRNTLKWHMKNIFEKFSVRNLSELSLILRR